MCTQKCEAVLCQVCKLWWITHSDRTRKVGQWNIMTTSNIIQSVSNKNNINFVSQKLGCETMMCPSGNLSHECLRLPTQFIKSLQKVNLGSGGLLSAIKETEYHCKISVLPWGWRIMACQSNFLKLLEGGPALILCPSPDSQVAQKTQLPEFWLLFNMQEIGSSLQMVYRVTCKFPGLSFLSRHIWIRMLSSYFAKTFGSTSRCRLLNANTARMQELPSFLNSVPGNY